jgi:hypothetical protein
MNASWHKRNPMPPRATAAQRLRWHVAHAKTCDCRALTPAMLARLRRAAQLETTKWRPRHGWSAP